jgi:hypothetical protein
MYNQFKVTIVLAIIVALLKLMPSPTIVTIVENDPTAFTKFCNGQDC